MLRASAFLTCVCFVLPSLAKAVDLNLSMASSVGYDNNVFREKNDESGDVSFRFGPTARIHSIEDNLVYNLSYNPVYEKFVDFGDLDELSHFIFGGIEYQFNDRTSIVLTNRFSLTQSLNRGPLVAEKDLAGDEIQEVPDNEVRRDDVYLNRALVSVQHSFTPHTVGQFDVSYDYFDSDRRNTAKNNAIGAVGSLTHALGARDRIGAGASFDWHRFDAVTGQPESDNFTYYLFGSWAHDFGKDTELSVRVGPALIHAQQDAPGSDLVDLYFHEDVEVSGTLADAYDDLGLQVPETVYVNGMTTDSSEPVSPGDVLVPFVPAASPTGANCFQSQVQGQPVFRQANCTLNNLITDPATAGAIGNGPKVLLSSDAGDDSDTRIAVFAEVMLSHNWTPKLKTTASYTRSDSGVSSLGANTIADRVTLVNFWTPTQRWNLSVRGDWLQRESSNDVTNTFGAIEPGVVAGADVVQFTGSLLAESFDDSVDTEYWSVSGRAAYRVSRRGTVTLRVTYQNQDSKRASTSTNSSFENVLASLGFRYDFDPFHF